MNFSLAILASCLLLVVVVAADDKFDPTAEPDLYCSACEIFVNELQSQAASKLKKDMAVTKKTSVLNKIVGKVCDGLDMDSVSGNTGERKFLNFMKAQNSGGDMSFNNLSMGPDVKQKFAKYCQFLANEHGSDAADAIARVARVYDVNLKKELCRQQLNACTGKKGKEL